MRNNIRMCLNFSLVWAVFIILILRIPLASADGKFAREGEIAVASTCDVDTNDRFSYEIFVCQKGRRKTSIYRQPNTWFSQPSFSPDGHKIAFYTYPVPDYSQQGSITSGNLSIQILNLENTKTERILNKEVEGTHFLPLLSPHGEWVPQWSSDGNNIYASVPFGQKSSGIEYHIWKIDIVSNMIIELPIPAGTHPVISCDDKWLFYCKIPVKESLGAHRDTSCYIVDLKSENLVPVKLPSAIVSEPLRVIFSENSRTLAILGVCDAGTAELPARELCLEFFRMQGNRWVLVKRVLLKDIKAHAERSVAKKDIKLELYISYSASCGLSLSPDGEKFIVLAYTQFDPFSYFLSGELELIEKRKKDTPEEILVCIFELTDISKNIEVAYKFPQSYEIWDTFLSEGKVSILLKRCNEELEAILLKVIMLPKIK